MWRAAIPDSYYPQLIADMCPLFAVHDAGLYLQIVKDLGRRLTKAINQYSTPSGRGVGKDLHFEAIRKKGVVLSRIHTAKKMAQRVSVLTDSLSASSS